MKISYAICTHNEDETLLNLLYRINEYLDAEDEIVVLDDYSNNLETLKILESLGNVHKNKLNKDFSNHKNILNSKCKGDFIFQLDSDELPSKHLMKNIKKIIELNAKKDLFYIPRTNKVNGITQKHLKMYKWKLDKFGRINYPDYQGRLFKNTKTIKWTRALHEHIIGHTNYTKLPTDSNLEIHHIKDIKTQERANQFYNDNYTDDFEIK